MSAAIFKKKKLEKPPNKRVCLRLKEARKSKGITLSQMAERTKINKNYIVALEECNFKELNCSDVYQKNFIKKYVQALGLDPRSFLSQFCDEETETKPKEDLNRKKYKKHYFANVPNTLKYITIGLVIIVLVSYLALQIKHTLEPPKLVIESPTEGYMTEENNVTVTGITDPEVRVSINGKDIMNNENGYFEEMVDLTLGINTIVTTAKNKRKKTTEIIRHVIYE